MVESTDTFPKKKCVFRLVVSFQMNDSIPNIPGTAFRVSNALSLAVKLAMSRIWLFLLLAIVCAMLPLVFYFQSGISSPEPNSDFEPLMKIALWSILLEILLWGVLNVLVIYFAAFELNLYEKVALKNNGDTRKEPRTAAWRLSSGFVTHIAAFIVILIGLALLVVPGIVLACLLAVTVTAAVIEGISPSAGFGRSRRLTQGHRKEIFLVLIIIVTADWVSSTLFKEVIERLITATNAHLLTILSVTPEYLFRILYATAALAIYYLLILEKEAAEFEEVADVFS